MTPVEEVLAGIRAIARDEHDKGDRFERLMLHAFRTDRTFRAQFAEVWRWMDWPGLRPTHRPGFDPGRPDAYRVHKMKHPKVTDPATGKTVDDRTRIVFNDGIIIEGIPERAYGDELGSRSAIGWVMEAWRVHHRQGVRHRQRPQRLGRRARRPHRHPRPRRAGRHRLDADARRRRVAPAPRPLTAPPSD